LLILLHVIAITCHFPPKVVCFLLLKLNIVKNTKLISEENIMWTKPNFEEMRLGFEVTLYISNR